MAILLIAEHDNTSLNDATRAAVTAAKAIGGDIDVLVAGSGAGDIAKIVAGIEGVSKVLHADGEVFAKPTAEAMEALVLPLMDKYDVMMAVASTMGKNFSPRIAAKLDVMQISEISAVESADTFVRPIYAGNAMMTVQSTDAKKVITVRPTTFEKAGDGGSASVETIGAPSGPFKSEFVSEELSKSDRPELTAAKIVISGGRGMQSGDNFVLLDKIADQLNAAVGASRAAVDAGYVPNDYQVGQTGKVVAPELYIAVGISGAIQHLAGMKDSKIIVAINKDEEAPIFSVADYGLVADLFNALPELEAELTKAGL
ncbi:electron transfer flavoprotein subunit alpha/FixB family protein [Hyphobacterium sp. CCMP332]|uniref:electron transfer flavoprotein subunit alpha/FixB family protein n=1 Tax=Hyphobacterium sp. CCMP332 TaxID=2749086 RepID=UPI001650982A|nr:FAD-binding protein [Hyphobacterium sp. CCMP332]QNL18004.1 electron transfer flavoprotein subunit alpha/FixB family protein [Hyphobacterium sp. CCMP332]